MHHTAMQLVTASYPHDIPIPVFSKDSHSRLVGSASTDAIVLCSHIEAQFRNHTLPHRCAVITRVLTSPSLSSANRRHLDRMSPTAGPPTTRTISAVLPPSSDTGSTCAMRVVKERKWPVGKECSGMGHEARGL